MIFKARNIVDNVWFFFCLEALANTDCGINIAGTDDNGRMSYANYADLEDINLVTGVKE